MCGICGEVRFDGRRPTTSAPSPGCPTRWCRADRTRPARTRSSRWRSAIVACAIIDLSARGGQPMVDSELRLSLVFNGCIYNYKELREELRQAGYRFSLHRGQRGGAQELPSLGPRLRPPLQGDVRLRGARDRLRGGDDRPRPARDKTSLLRADAGAVAVRLDVAGAVARRRRGHDDRSCGVAPLPELRGGRAGPLTMFEGVRKLPPATIRVVQPDGSFHREALLGAEFRTRPGSGVVDAAAVADGSDGLACAPPSPAGWSPMCRSGCCSRAVSIRVCSWHCSPSRGSGTSPPSASDSTRRRRIRKRVLLLRPGRPNVRHRPPPDPHRPGPAAGGGPRAIEAMSEPMLSHDCVAFFLLSEEVSKSVKVVQSGQGAEILAGYHWYPPLVGWAREQSAERTPRCTSTGPRRHRDDARARLPCRSRRQYGVRRPAHTMLPCRHRRGRGAAARHDSDARGGPGQAGRHDDDGVGARGPRAVPRPRVRRVGRHVSAGPQVDGGGKVVLKRPAAVCSRTP